MSEGTIEWKEGDLFTLPAVPDALHTATKDSALYWVHDGPLLNYLGVAPKTKRFSPVLYTKERLTKELNAIREEAAGRNRTGVLLANPHFPQTMTLTHTLWSLYNALPAGVVQKPHRHNSIALDYCVDAGPDTYTMIAQGNRCRRQPDQSGQGHVDARFGFRHPAGLVALAPQPFRPGCHCAADSRCWNHYEYASTGLPIHRVSGIE